MDTNLLYYGGNLKSDWGLCRKAQRQDQADHFPAGAVCPGAFAYSQAEAGSLL